MAALMSQESLTALLQPALCSEPLQTSSGQRILKSAAQNTNIYTAS